MSEQPLGKTRWFEEKPGVESSSRIFSAYMMLLGGLQTVLGCWILLLDNSALAAAGAAWTASISTFGFAYQMKNNAKKIEEGCYPPTNQNIAKEAKDAAS